MEKKCRNCQNELARLSALRCPLMEYEGSHFSTGGHFSPPGLGVMTRFLQTKNDPFGRRK